MLIENTFFRLAAGADEQEFLAADARVQQAFFYAQDGVLRRTLAKADDGEWLACTFWYDAESADKAAVAAEGEATVKAFRGFLDPASVRLTRHTDIGG